MRKLRAFIAGAALVGAVPSPAHAAETEASGQTLQDCLAAGLDPFHDDECYSAHLERQEERLKRAFGGARQYMANRHRETSRPEYALQDTRRDPAYLDRSQAAWRKFVEEDCAVRAGILWGANIWVSRGERDCYLGELQRRIIFLESIASGEFSRSVM